MKHLLLRLRPLVLLLALCLVFTNCSDDYNTITTATQGRESFSTSKRLTGREAQQQVNELVNELNKGGKKGMTKLMRSLDAGTGSNMRTSLHDIKPYIDSTEVLVLTDSVHRKKNYTYRLKHPDANKTTFYNLVMREYNGYRRITLITYKMSNAFATTYYATESLSKFTGQILFEIIAQDEDDPCEEPNPPSAGGGGGSGWLANPYEGVYVPPSNVNQHQLMVQAHLMELGMVEVWHDVSRSPRYLRLAFTLNSPTNDEDPCNEDEAGVLEPELTPCEKLQNLINNDTIKKSLTALGTKLEHPGNDIDEYAYSFKKSRTGETTATRQTASGNSHANVPVNQSTYGVAHIHPDGMTTEGPLIKMFSMGDVRTAFMCTAKYNINFGPQSLFFNIMTVNEEEGPYSYIVFPNDVAAFKSMSNEFLNIENYSTLDTKLQSAYEKALENGGTDHLTLAKVFLQFFNNTGSKASGTNFNLSVYRIGHQNNFGGGWEKISLDPQNLNNQPILTPCN